MDYRVIEILIHLLGHLREHSLDIESLDEFSEGLVVKGYSEDEVHEAVQWFLDQLSTRTVLSSEAIEQRSESVRILHDYERLAISPDIYGYLIRLRKLSVITGAQLERIIDYYLLFGKRTGSETDINELIAGVLFEEYL